MLIRTRLINNSTRSNTVQVCGSLQSFASGQFVCVLTKESNIPASCFMDRMPADREKKKNKKKIQPFVALEQFVLLPRQKTNKT